MVEIYIIYIIDWIESKSEFPLGKYSIDHSNGKPLLLKQNVCEIKALGTVSLRTAALANIAISRRADRLRSTHKSTPGKEAETKEQQTYRRGS